MEGVEAGRSGARRAGFGRGTGVVGGLVDVFAVNIDSIGLEGRTAVALAGVALLEAEELDLSLDTVEDAHFDGVERD